MSEVQTTANPLGTDRIGKLLRGFARSQLDEIEKELNERFGDMLNVEIYDSLVGAGIGAGLSGLFSEKTLSAILRLAGLSHVICNFDVPALLVPAAFITAAVFVFAYVTSRRVRRVEVRELIVE